MDILRERRILVLHDPKQITKEEIWLRKAYANIVSKMILRAITPSSKIDEFSSMFIGFRSIESDKFNHYQGLMEITSYIWASKGGRGSLLEKAIAAAAGPNAKRGIAISDLAQWIARAKGNNEIKEWNLTESAPKLKFDLINIIDDRLVLLEIKNRVDSGGTSAREETLEKKFLKLCKYIQTGEKYFVGDGKEMDIAQTLLRLGIEKIEMHKGFLFSAEGTEASIEDDKEGGFYGQSRQLLSRYYQDEDHRHKVKLRYEDNLQRLSFEKDGLAVSVDLQYGNDITRSFTHEQLGLVKALDNVFTRKWDDVWLTLLLAISQRSILLQHNTNHIIELDRIYELQTDRKFATSLDKFVANPSNTQSLSECVHIAQEDDHIKKLPDPLSSAVESVESQFMDCMYVYAAYRKQLKGNQKKFKSS